MLVPRDADCLQEGPIVTPRDGTESQPAQARSTAEVMIGLEARKACGLGELVRHLVTSAEAQYHRTPGGRSDQGIGTRPPPNPSRLGCPPRWGSGCGRRPRLPPAGGGAALIHGHYRLRRFLRKAQPHPGPPPRSARGQSPKEARAIVEMLDNRARSFRWGRPKIGISRDPAFAFLEEYTSDRGHAHAPERDCASRAAPLLPLVAHDIQRDTSERVSPLTSKVMPLLVSVPLVMSSISVPTSMRVSQRSPWYPFLVMR